MSAVAEAVRLFYLWRGTTGWKFWIHIKKPIDMWLVAITLSLPLVSRDCTCSQARGLTCQPITLQLTQLSNGECSYVKH
jgi:hypothetical protein